MALQAIRGGFMWPHELGSSGAGDFSAITIDAVNEKVGYVLQIRKAGVIDRVAFRTREVATGATMDVRVETVGGDGFPTGTLWATTTNASQVIGDGDDDTWFEVTLTSTATVSVGNLIAVVIAAPGSGTFNLTIANSPSSFFADTGSRGYRPYSVQFLSGAWSKPSPDTQPVVAVRFNDGVWQDTYTLPYKTAHSAVSFGSGDSPDERGIIFQLPFACKVGGCWLRSDLTGDPTVKLYDSDGSTTLATATVDQDQQEFQSAGSTGAMRVFFAEVTLAKDTNYRLTLLPTATSVSLDEYSVHAAAYWDAFPGGQQVHLTTRTDAGAWTETTTRRALMGLYITAIDDGAGGAGPLIGGGLIR